MKIYFIINGFLGSVGTELFIKNCYLVLSKNKKVLNLSHNPELIYIEEPFFIKFLKIISKKYKKTNIKNIESKFEIPISKKSWLYYLNKRIFNKAKFFGITTFQHLIFPNVCYLADCQYMHYPYFFTPQSRIERKLRVILSLLTAKKALVNSISVKKDIQKFFSYLPTKKIVSLPFMTIPVENINENSNSLEKYGLKNLIGKDFVLLSNRWWTHKNHMKVIEAFNQIKKEKGDKFISNLFLVITGSKEGTNKSYNYYQSAIEYINKNKLNKNILILGHVSDDLHSLLFKKTIGIIQPTLFEGGPGGFAIWNAVDLNLPISCSDIEINLELKSYINNINYFDPNCSKQIKNALYNLYSKKIKNSKLINPNKKLLELNYSKVIIKTFQ